MKASKLIEVLQSFPPDTLIHIDEEEYPQVTGAYPAENLTTDPEEAPPVGVVLLEVTRQELD